LLYYLHNLYIKSLFLFFKCIPILFTHYSYKGIKLYIHNGFFHEILNRQWLNFTQAWYKKFKTWVWGQRNGKLKQYNKQLLWIVSRPFKWTILWIISVYVYIFTIFEWKCEKQGRHLTFFHRMQNQYLIGRCLKQHQSCSHRWNIYKKNY